MATQKMDGLFTDAGESNADLTGKEFLFCKRLSTGKIDLAGLNDVACGVISQGRIAGKHTSFNTRGNPILKVIAGGSINIGDQVQVGANGKAVSGSTNPWGRARNNAATSEYVEIEQE